MIEIYVRLSVMTALTVMVSAGLYLAEKKTAFGAWKPNARQVLYGVIFGALSVCGTEFGVTVEGITFNESTAAPLCAGLIFGAPAGLIAGLIGGVERYLATFWGAGYYGRFAGSIAILFAGVSGAAMRRFMFDNKKPAWYYGLAAGLIAEVVDMLLLLLTRVDDIRRAFYTVELGAVPLALMNGLAVMLSLLLVAAIGKDRRGRGTESARAGLVQTFQKWLLVCVTLAFLATSVFTFWVEDGISGSQVESMLKLNITDVSRDILEASDANLLKVARETAVLLQVVESDADKVTSETLRGIQNYYRVAELDLVDENGIVTATTREGAEGYDMASEEQSAVFMELLDGKQEMVQSYQPTGFDPSVYRKYAGIALEGGGFLQVGYDAAQFQQDIADQAAAATMNRHVGEQGFIVVCDENWRIVSDSSGHTGQVMQDLDTTGYRLNTESITDFEVFRADIYGVFSHCMYMQTEGYIILGVIPETEAVFARNVSLYVSLFMEVIIFTILFVLIYILIKRLIIDNIHRINRSLARITEGNLDVKVDVRANEEFASLSDDINATVDVLKHYIDEAASRIDKELALARAIQASALPSVFPPYPARTEFDIWAGMRPAKEVGGDFYDFYMLGDNKLGFLVADVSGKGIPAAMFMMTAKTLIKSLAETGMPVEQVMTEANEHLCAENSAGMFVTAWMGILNLETGLVTFANAGHNPPLLRKGTGGFEYLRSRAGLVLAAMEGIAYRRNEVQLEPGDVIYLYTDGVTEATNGQQELYGEERLKCYLDRAGGRGEAAPGMPEDASTEVPADAPAKAPTDASTEAPADALTEAPADASTNASADVSTNALADASTETPADALSAAEYGQNGPGALLAWKYEPESVCRGVLADVDRFAGDAPQFDDITMVCLRYRGHGQEITTDAAVERAGEVTEFVERCLGEAGCPQKTVMQINVIVDEIFTNIASYAYGNKPGSATVRVAVNENLREAVVTFLDQGIPFNPLDREDPDVTVRAEDRAIGGLGIFLAKQMSDEIGYEYRDHQNILTVRKKF